jgi:class 3 adenylate cyclase
LERKLAAILCADVHGYSRLMGENEEATLRTLTSHRKLIDSAIKQHHGRFVNSALALLCESDWMHLRYDQAVA